MVIRFMDIVGYYIGGYFRLNYHRLLMAIGGVILLMDICGYFIGAYRWLFCISVCDQVWVSFNAPTFHLQSVPIMGFGYQQNLNFANPLSLIT